MGASGASPIPCTYSPYLWEIPNLQPPSLVYHLNVPLLSCIVVFSRLIPPTVGITPRALLLERNNRPRVGSWQKNPRLVTLSLSNAVLLYCIESRCIVVETVSFGTSRGPPSFQGRLRMLEVLVQGVRTMPLSSQMGCMYKCRVTKSKTAPPRRLLPFFVCHFQHCLAIRGRGRFRRASPPGVQGRVHPVANRRPNHSVSKS